MSIPAVDNEMLVAAMQCKFPHDFEMIVDDKRYPCYKFLVSCFSNSLRTILQFDSTVSSYKLEMSDPDGKFRHIADYLNGKSLALKRESLANLTFIFKASSLLHINGLAKDVLSHIKSNFTFKDLFDIIDYFDDELASDADFIAKAISDNFFERSDDLLEKKMPFKILSKAFQRPDFRYKDFKSLSGWVIKYKNKYGRCYLDLLKDIEFDGVSDLDPVLEMNDRDLLFYFSSQIRKALNSRVKSSSVKYEIPYVESKHYEGIFNFLTKETGGNPLLNKTLKPLVKVNSSYFHDILDYGAGLRKHYKNDSNASTCEFGFDFIDLRVSLSAYTITSCYCQDYGCWPKSFDILGSRDGSKWFTIDSVRNTPHLRGRYKTYTFQCRPSAPVKYIKYVQKENHHQEKAPFLHLSVFEIFGTLTGFFPHKDPKESGGSN